MPFDCEAEQDNKLHKEFLSRLNLVEIILELSNYCLLKKSEEESNESKMNYEIYCFNHSFACCCGSFMLANFVYFNSIRLGLDTCKNIIQFCCNRWNLHLRILPDFVDIVANVSENIFENLEFSFQNHSE